MKQVYLVAKETYLQQVKSWSFLLLLLSPFLLLLISFGSGYLGAAAFDDSREKTIALVTSNPELTSQLTDLQFSTDFPDEKAAQAALKEEKIQAYLLVQDQKGQIMATYHGKERPDAQVQDQIQTSLNKIQVVQNQKEADLNPDQVTFLNRTASYEEEIPADQEMAKWVARLGSLALIFFLYMISLTYMTSTGMEIASEKGTKILEIIFSSVPSDLYFYGRVLGMMLTLITHIGLYAIGGSLAYLYGSTLPGMQQIFDPLHLVLANVNWLLLPFLIFGLMIFVVLSAFCGCLVTRQEDVNKALQPVSVLIMAAFILSMAFSGNGDSLAVQVLSYVPIFSTFILPVRMISGDADLLQTLLSLLILVVTTGLLTFLFGKSYGGIALQSDDLSPWKSLKKGLTTK